MSLFWRASPSFQRPKPSRTSMCFNMGEGLYKILYMYISEVGGVSPTGKEKACQAHSHKHPHTHTPVGHMLITQDYGLQQFILIYSIPSIPRLELYASSLWGAVPPCMLQMVLPFALSPLLLFSTLGARPCRGHGRRIRVDGFVLGGIECQPI